jgi:hypothetical protein
MKNVLLAVWALILTTSFADAPLPQEEVATCPGSPPPLPTYTELDPNPARYAGFGLPGEPVTQWPDEPGYVLSDKGATITYQDAGQLYSHECPDKISYWFEEDRWVMDKKKCWIRMPVKISECP